MTDEAKLEEARTHLARFESRFDRRSLAAAAELLLELLDGGTPTIQAAAQNVVRRYSTRMLNIAFRLRSVSKNRHVLEYWHNVMAEFADPSLGVSAEYCKVTEDLSMYALSLKPGKEWTPEESERYNSWFQENWLKCDG